MRVAIVQDWLIGGGAERVTEQLHKMFPDAPIYTSYCTPQWRKNLDNKVVTGYLQHWPFSKLRKLIPFLRGLWFSSLNLKNYDLVISISGAEAKFIKVKASTVHIAYINAPTHYYWNRYYEYLKEPGFGAFNWLARLGLKLLVGPMRKWDYKAAQRPNYVIANSTHTQKMVKKYYNRDSVVIHPPVSVKRFQIPNSKFQIPRKGFLIAGRQTPYKRFDLAIAACAKLNLPLTVIGNGPEHKKLKQMAGPSITFINDVADKEMPKYFQNSQAFIFPGLDDFGIVAVEALAAGTPVIAYKAGGALDYVIDGKTGLFFDEQTAQSLTAALQRFSKHSFWGSDLSRQADLFSAGSFRANIKKFLEKKL